MKVLCTDCGPGGAHTDLPVKALRIKSLWLKHGLIGAPLSLISRHVCDCPFQHWWVEIETDQPQLWYGYQFENFLRRYRLALKAFPSALALEEEARRMAFRGAGKGRIGIVQEVHPDKLTLGQLHDWITQHADDHYRLFNNNCQHVAKNLLAEINKH